MSRQIRLNPSQRNFNISLSWKFVAGQLAIAGLFALAIPAGSASAFNEFDVCTNELLRAEVSPEQAARACADALEPKDLSLCVLKIRALTPLGADETIAACLRVRRPLELADCVVDIDRSAEDPDAANILSNCRRSLLPRRFSDCVQGLTREANLTATSAMDTCIAAEDFEPELFPTFAPPPPDHPSPPVIPDFTPEVTPGPEIEIDPPVSPETPIDPVPSEGER
jgi:hypothetical protein